ncbi:capsular biosynthesis protein [Sporosarcina oncorhynchi]|uniref:Tyrosine-protein phosphatase n=1 Tax=Sporosarcina oncorhynchi TaxID=3056444 RepID=A0ABZ0L9R7_9BACL|nr:CpsB/CapC family capsule biosynthesis tyrosine phosphatase [Sporosarcina sp. T2O-4]WOV89220.1 capsular biosynthesis protein [Sporosarcina sp. T2O-4]
MHVHLLYGVDDGPKHVETSIQMLKMASEQGITEIIITPHAFHPSYDVRPNTIKRLVPELAAITKQLNINIQLHTGQEIRLHENLIEHIHSGEALTLANSRYLLLEMPSYTVPLFSFQMIESIVHDGFIPIIAHPERNIAIISDPHILQRLIKLGAYAQVNADSLLGIYGRRVQKIAFQLIKANLIHCYGSDTHNITTRKNHFWKGLRVLEKKKLSTIVEVLLNNNHCILADEPFSL